MILGSGFTNDPNLSPTTKLSNSVLARMAEGVGLYNKLDSAYFITSGASVNSSISQAQAVAEAAISLGVLPKDTLHLSDTFITEDEARSCRSRLDELTKRFPEQNIDIYLVTSAIHMPRAVYWFSKYGIPVTPVPCDFLVKEDPQFPKSGLIPSWRKMDILNSVIYESMGMFYARYLSD
ncbi:MAG: YdcF family protein [Ignavibacteriales bacterium]|nr:MAG: YdcF family protein [Ignavibacteriales bacterium]